MFPLCHLYKGKSKWTMGVGRVVQAALAVILDPRQVVLDLVLTLFVDHQILSVLLYFWAFVI